MIGLLSQNEHKQFHEGLEGLGRCLGAETTRTTEQGAPDVVWSFEETHVAFEAKTEKAADSALSKSDVLQARGHIDWVRAKLADNDNSVRIESVIVSPAPDLDDAARPHSDQVYWVQPDVLRTMGTTGATLLEELRQTFNGSDFGQVKDEVCTKVKLNNLHRDGLIETLTKNPLRS